MNRQIAFLLMALVSTASLAKPKVKKEISIVFLGDSITAGYGVELNEAFPALLERKYASQPQKLKVTNAGISGSTSASGPSRLKWILRSKPDVVFIELGANDGLRGQSTEATKKNLQNMIQMTRSAGAKAVLMGMKLPPNYGSDYRKKFAKIYTDLQEDEKVPFIPFEDKFFGHKEWIQSDGLHPNKKGHVQIASLLASFIDQFLFNKGDEKK